MPRHEGRLAGQGRADVSWADGSRANVGGAYVGRCGPMCTMTQESA